MKNKLSKIVAGALLAAAFASQSAAADEKSTTSAQQIVVVDTQAIFEKSTAVQKIREQVDKKAEDFKKEYTKKEEYFKTKYEDLEKQKGTLAQDAFNKKNDDLTKEFGDAQKKANENRGALDKAYMEAMQQVDKTFTDIVKDEAAKVGAKVVLHKMQTIYSDNSLEITDKVLESLNKKLSSVSVKF